MRKNADQISAEFNAEGIAVPGAIKPHTQNSAVLLRFEDAVHADLDCME